MLGHSYEAHLPPHSTPCGVATKPDCGALQQPPPSYLVARSRPRPQTRSKLHPRRQPAGSDDTRKSVLQPPAWPPDGRGLGGEDEVEKEGGRCEGCGLSHHRRESRLPPFFPNENMERMGVEEEKERDQVLKVA